MARDVPETGSLDSHPDFPDFFRLARELVGEDFVPRYDRAAAAGNIGEAERIQARVDALSRQRAITTLRTMVDGEAGRGPIARALARAGITATAGETSATPPPVTPPADPTAGIDYSRTPGRDSPLDVLTRMSPAEMMRLMDLTPADLEEAIRNPPPMAPTLGGPGRIDTTRLPSAEELRPDLALRNPLPDGPPPVAGAPPPPELGLGGGGFNEILNPSVRGAMMPQSRGEQEEFDRSNRSAAAVVDAAGIAAPFAIPGGPIAAAARGAGALARGAGNLLARAPRATAAATVGGATALGTGQTETPNEVDTARNRVTTLEGEDKDLVTRRGLFDNLVDPRGIRDRTERERAADRVRAAQAALNIDQDGRYGIETRAAIDAERKRITDERARVSRELVEARAARERLLGAGRLREMEPGPFERYGPLLGIPLGYFVGSRLGRYLGGRVEANVASRTERANELVTPPGRMSMDRRIGRSNQFWTEGGSAEAPFSRAVGRTPPWTPNPNALPAERLYRRNFVENAGPGLVTGGVGAAEMGTGWALDARERVERAWAAVRANPNDEAALQELAAARSWAATADTLFNFGRGTLLGGAVSEAKRFVGTGSTRPDIGRAEGERGLLDRMLDRRTVARLLRLVSVGQQAHRVVAEDGSKANSQCR